MAFYNPYNFIPAPRRNRDDAELGDHPPAGHQAYFPNKWSGRLYVSMMVETPLLVPDLPRNPKMRHKIYGTRIGSDGQPYLPPTSIKGMLRSAFEAVTNSRMGILQRHDERLAFRKPATEGLSLVPAIVYSDRIELMMGSTPVLPRRNAAGQWHLGGHPLHAAWLPRYKGGTLNYLEGGSPQHRDTAHAVLEPISRPPFKLWRVRAITQDPALLPATDPPPTATGHYTSLGSCIRAVGYVVITNQNTLNKHDERFFFVEPGLTPSTILLTRQEFKNFHDAWRDLIHSYQDAHREGDVWRRNDQGAVIPPETFTPQQGQRAAMPALSPHIYQDGRPRRDNSQPQDDASVLVDGTLCYAHVAAIAPGGVKALYPVPIARELYDQPPINLIDQSIRPASSPDELSPADRVFGWVKTDGAGAYRGQLRVSLAQCTPPGDGRSLELFDPPLPLAILSAPKPQQARFYLAADAGGTPLDAEKAAAYLPTQRIRGRKVYPHQRRGRPETYWAPPDLDVVNEYVRPVEEQDGQRKRREDTQNRSIESWVRPATTFSFSIHVVNLSHVELGALIWLLSLGDQHFHRFGGGKPLGFGSVKLDLSGAELANGAAIKDEYRALGAAPAAANTPITQAGSKRISSASDPLIAQLLSEYQNCVAGAYQLPFEQVSFIKAFRKAARGFGPTVPTHYPRSSPNPDSKGENFKWFGENRLPLKRIDDGHDPYFA